MGFLYEKAYNNVEYNATKSLFTLLIHSTEYYASHIKGFSAYSTYIILWKKDVSNTYK